MSVSLLFFPPPSNLALLPFSRIDIEVDDPLFTG